MSLHPYRLIATILSAIVLASLSGVSGAAQAKATGASPRSFAALAAKADAARDTESLDEAVKLYHDALALRPSWAEGWWSLGMIDYDQDHYAKAAVDFRKLLALQPENGTAHAMLGLCDFELGLESQALQHIQKGKNIGLSKDGGLWNVVLYHEGILLQRAGKFQAAQEALEDLCFRGAESDDVANLLGMTLLRRTSKTPPPPDSRDADVVVRLGRSECLIGAKKLDEARPGLAAVVKENPDYPNIHYAYGLSLIELRDVAGGVDEFKQEIKNHPDNLLARLRIAAVLYKEDSSAGIPYAEEAVRMAPQQPFGHYLLGLLRLDTDDYANAIPELEIAKKGLPNEARIYAALGTAYSRAGRPQDAARARATFQRLNAEAKKSAETAPGDQSEPTRLPVPDVPSPQ